MKTAQVILWRRRLPLLLGIAALLPFALALMNAQIAPKSLDIGDAPLNEQSLAKRIYDAEYSGRTGSREIYTIKAKWAEPDSVSPSLVTLNGIEGSLQMASRIAYLKAPEGFFLPKTERLDLAGRVELFTSDGYRAEAEAIEVLGAEKKAFASGPVRISGREGKLTADRAEAVDENGAVLIFSGKVRLTLLPFMLNQGKPTQ